MVVDVVDRAGFGFVWPENVAGAGGDEIATCLLHLFTDPSFQDKYRGVKKFIVWADNCFAQNKNNTVVAALMLILDLGIGIEEIVIKYGERGHTFLAVDAAFGQIERRKKLTDRVDLAEEWCDVMCESRVRTSSLFGT